MPNTTTDDLSIRSTIFKTNMTETSASIRWPCFVFKHRTHGCMSLPHLSSMPWWPCNSPLSSKHATMIPGSLTQWKTWYPPLFSSLKMTPFFVVKHWLLSSKQPLFRDKTQTFLFKMNPLFCGKTLTFQPKWTPFFAVKQWTSKLTPFSPNSRRWVPKYPLFLGICESWISSKNTSLFVNFRTRMRMAK